MDEVNARTTRPSGLDESMGSATLILFPGALGDFLCFYPALTCLLQRASANASEIRVRPDLFDLLGNDQKSLVAHPLDSSEVRALFVAGSHADASLRDFFDRFARIYSWTGSRDETFRQNITALAPGRVHLFPFRPGAPCGRMRDYYLSCVGATHTGGDDRELRLPIRPQARVWAGAFSRARGISHVPVLAIAPGSGAPAKNWPSEHFAAVSEWWQAHEKGLSLLIAGPVERERWKGEAPAYPGAVDAGDLSLDQLAALFGGCCAMLGNDSGTTHLAAAVGIPTFALFGPTDPAQWKPWGRSVTVVTSDLSESSFAPAAGEGGLHRSCLEDLAPDVLIGLLEQRLVQGHLDKQEFRYFNESRRLCETHA